MPTAVMDDVIEIFMKTSPYCMDRGGGGRWLV